MGIQIRTLILTLVCMAPCLFADQWFYTKAQEDILLTEIKAQFQELTRQHNYQKAWQMLDQVETQYNDTLEQKKEDSYLDHVTVKQWIQRLKIWLLHYDFPLNQALIDDKKLELQRHIKTLEEFNLWHHDEEDGYNYWKSLETDTDPKLLAAKKKLWLNKMYSLEDGEIDSIIQNEPYYATYEPKFSFGTPLELTSYYAGLGDVIALHGCEAAILYWKKALFFWGKIDIESDRSNLKELEWDKLGLAIKLGFCYRQTGNKAELDALNRTEFIEKEHFLDDLFTLQDLLRRQDEIILKGLKPKASTAPLPSNDFKLDGLTRWCDGHKCYDSNQGRLFISRPFYHRMKTYILSMDVHLKVYLDVYSQFNQKLLRQFYICSATQVWPFNVELQKGIIVARQINAEGNYLFLDPLRLEVLDQNFLTLSPSTDAQNFSFYLTVLYFLNAVPSNYYTDVQWQRLITDESLKTAITRTFVEYDFVDESHKNRSLLLAQYLDPLHFKDAAMAYMSHDDPEIRKKALKNWKLVSNDPNPYFMALKDTDPTVGEVALKELKSYSLTIEQIQPHIDFLKECVHSSIPELQYFSVNQLTTLMAFTDIFDFIKDQILFRAANSEIEKKILEITIRNLDSKITPDAAIPCLASPEPKVRLWALQTLCKKRDTDTLGIFVHHIRNEQDPEVLWRTVTAINQFASAQITSPDALNAVIDLLEHMNVPNPRDIEMAIIETLSLYPTTSQTYEVLLKLSNDSNAEIKSLASRTIRNLINPESLEAILLDGHLSKIHIPLINTLGFTGNRPAIPIFLDILKGKNSLDLKLATLWSLFRIDIWDKTVLQTLGELAISEKYLPLKKDTLKILCIRSDYFHYAVYILYIFETEPELFNDPATFDCLSECIGRLSRKTPLAMERLDEIGKNHITGLDIESSEISILYQKVKTSLSK